MRTAGRQARGSAVRLHGAGLMRAMFVIYLLVIVTGLVVFITIGVIGR
jgi:hypothetical protein